MTTNPYMTLLQYGAIGAILTVFLLLFVKIFRSLIDNLMKQNQQLWEIQQKQLTSLQSIEGLSKNVLEAVTKLDASVRTLDVDVSMMFNELTGSRRIRIDAPRTRVQTSPETPAAKNKPGSD